MNSIMNAIFVEKLYQSTTMAHDYQKKLRTIHKLVLIFTLFERKFQSSLTQGRDVTKVFDTIGYKILLHNINKFGINSTAYNLLSIYLKNRKQHIRINNELSEETSLSHCLIYI
ncbi:Reverse transcriptase domain-containing protein [Aphis craccivora]|uniref:Reverse transcriptase domain-containing protein n=1 Tax=Aphis craccivora TaxID=307492 RepID=A0A6G0YLI3_APHCR|nr:Reverse transcriptase domain-containing protein [Aphis craccivora]